MKNSTTRTPWRTRWWKAGALALAVGMLGIQDANSQVNYSFNFDANSTGWTGDFLRSTSTTGCGGTPVMRRNLYSGATTGSLISPLTGTAAGGLITISYDYKVNNWSANNVGSSVPWGSFTVEYGATASGPWTPIATVSEEAQTSACIGKSHTFTPPTGALYVRWNCAWTGGDNYWNFDNVVLAEAVAPCSGQPNAGSVPSPVSVCAGGTTVLTATGLTSNLAPGISYQWEESFDGSTGWFSVVDGSGATTSSYTTSAINTTRYFRIKSTCSTGPDENVSNVVTVNALSGFDEDFSSGNLTANCWTPSGTALLYNSVSAFGVGTGSARWNFYSASTVGSEHALTSAMLSAVGSGMQLEFDVAGSTYTGGEVDTIKVQESNDGGTTWTTIVSMTNEVGGLLNTNGGTSSGAFTPSAAQWTSLAFPLSAGTNRVRFLGISDYGNDCFVDNIAMTAVPTCQAPTGAGASNATGDGADIAWTCTSCTGTYIVEYGAPGFTPGTDGTAGVGGTIWTGSPVAGSPVTLTGLSALTAYQVYVREVCPGPDYSPNSIPTSFTTLCGGTSCNYTARIGDIYGDGWDGSVWEVKENGVTIATLGPQLTSGCNGGTGYVDISVPVCEGSSLELEWTVLGSFTTEKALQFFDANGILLYDFRGTSTSPNCPQINWTSANSTASLGVKWSGTSSCAPPACLPATGTAVAVPNCPGGFNVDVDVTGFGETLSVPESSVTIDYTVNAVPQTAVVVNSLGITTLTGFANGDVVVVTLTHAGDNSCDATLNSVSYTCPPANDLCADAIMVSCNSVTNATTVNATTTGAPATTCGGYSINTAGGIWYTLQGWDGTMTIDLSGSSFDTKLAVYTGTCGALVCVDGDDDDGAGTTSLVTFAGSATETYYVYVTGFGTNTGSVVMTISCGDNNNACPANGVTVETDNDSFVEEDNTHWEIRAEGTNVVAVSGSGLVNDATGQTTFGCLPDGCYYLVFLDDFGDGMDYGGYVLREQGGAQRRIIDNKRDAYGNGGFSDGFVSQIANNLGFCLPMGDDRVIFTSTDKIDWRVGPCNAEYIYANDNPAVTAQYGVSNATSGYQMWWFDPNGGYSFRRFQSHSTNNGLPVSATRACGFKLNNWSGNQLQQGVLYNVKVRGRVNGTFLPWGQASRFMLDDAAAQCPNAHLMDIPGNQFLSCGQFRDVAANAYVHARPVKRMQANCTYLNANRYQFRFRIVAENFVLVKTSATGQYWVNTIGLECGKTYEVDVRASFDNGATWCNMGGAGLNDPAWGDVCMITTNNCLTGGNASIALQGNDLNGALTMYPNPNHGDQLLINLTQVEEGVNTVSVDIYDGFGKRVAARTIAVQDGYLNTVLELNGELATGMYLVNITAGSTVHTERLVIQP
ncbi:MAG: T9SS type A sorting domain-containing protein [Flavobacteriales bacterium]|nr:T9SS type A sorting domain-containing protein [Flavobacteriales bacterium]